MNDYSDMHKEYVDEVWFIEAPGKASQMQSILKEIGIDARVQATKGHFMKFSDNIRELGINKACQELDRAPVSEEIIAKIRNACEGVKKAVIATDADKEGEVIAWDVYETIKDIVPLILRVRLKAIDDESIQDAIMEATPIQKEDAIPGRTRAIIDRIIGSSYAKEGIVAGRIGSAILGLCARGGMSSKEIYLVAPAPETNRPWVARTPVISPLTMEIAEKLTKTKFPTMYSLSPPEVIKKKPEDMGRIMVRVSDDLGISPKDTAEAMQIAYETGRLSYPRSSSRSMTKKAAKKLEKNFKKSGFKFNAETVEDKDEMDAHDSPYPVGGLDISLDPERLGRVEGVRVLIGRNLVKTGQKITKEKGNASILREFLIKEGFNEDVADFVAKLDWQRENGPHIPGDKRLTESHIIKRRADAVLLEKCIEAGIGRPSTWANHIDRFFERELVDYDLNLTDKGRWFLEGTPNTLLNPKVSAAIEKACEAKINSEEVEGREPWERLAERIISALPGELKDVMQSGLEDRQKERTVSKDHNYGNMDRK